MSSLAPDRVTPHREFRQGRIAGKWLCRRDFHAAGDRRTTLTPASPSQPCRESNQGVQTLGAPPQCPATERRPRLAAGARRQPVLPSFPSPVSTRNSSRSFWRYILVVVAPGDPEPPCASEHHHPAPPRAVASPSRASLNPGNLPSGSRMMRGVLPTQKPVDSTPGWPISAISGEFSPRAAAGTRRRRVPPPLPPRSKPHRPIRNRRPRLEPVLIRSGPLDLNPAAWIHAYRFGHGFLLKSPRPFSESTRSPPLLKNNCS